MKTTLFLFLAILLISHSYQSECDDKTGPSNKKDCNSLKVSAGSYKCCFAHYKGKGNGSKGEYKTCEEIDQETYNRIKDYIKEAEEAAKNAGGKLTLKIDCSSNYLLISTMSLILLLFL